MEYNLLPDLACAELAGCEILLSDRPLVFRRAYDGRRPLPNLMASNREFTSSFLVVLVVRVTPRILTSRGAKIRCCHYLRASEDGPASPSGFERVLRSASSENTTVLRGGP